MNRKKNSSAVRTFASSLIALVIDAAVQPRHPRSSFISYTNKFDLEAEKTKALTALFETQAFKDATSYGQERLIRAIQDTYK